MKLCPKCELNYIDDDAEMCSVCAAPSKKAGGRHSDVSPDDAEKLLRQMGAAWFVSYKWYDSVDKTHKNWEVVSLEWRISVYDRTKEFHDDWLKRIIKMDESKLDKNQIGLSGREIIDMAKKMI